MKVNKKHALGGYPSLLRSLFVLLLLVLFSYSSVASKLSYRFAKKPLSEALEQIGAENKVKIAFDSQLAAKVVLNGKYAAKSMDELLASILATSNFEFKRIGSVYVVKPKRNDTVELVEQPMPPVAKTIEIPKYKIWGAVVDQTSGEKLPYAYIYTLDGKYSTTANSDGYFNLILPSHQPVTLCISFLGFEKKCIDVVPESRSGMMSINLDRLQTVLGSVVVTQKQNYLVQILGVAGKNTLNPKAASDVPSINQLDFTAPLQLLAGVDATTESASTLSVRKSPSSQTQILFDGFTLYHINHFLGQLSAFNAKAIKDIQVYKGGFDARYGGAASSVIEITGKSGNRYKANYSIGADLLSVDGFADVPLSKKVSWVFAARRSYTDMYQTKLYDNLFSKLRNDLDQTSLTNISIYDEKYSPKYFYFDIHSKLTYNPDSTQSVSLSVYGGEDNMDLGVDKPRTTLKEQSDIDNFGIGVKWSKQLSERYFFRSSVGYSTYKLDFSHLNSFRNLKAVELARRYNELDNELKDLTVRSEGEYRVTPAVGLIGGVSFTSVSSSYTLQNYRMTLNNVEIDTTRRAGTNGWWGTFYLMGDVAKGVLKNFKPGVRVTYFEPTRKVYFEPRVQMSVEVAEYLLVKAAVGRYLQFMSRVPTSYMGDYTGYWAVANNGKYPVLFANHYIAGFTYDATKSLQFDVEAYRKSSDGSLSQVLIPTLVGGKYALQQRELYTSNVILGVDFMAKLSLPRGQVALAYTLSKSTVTAKNFRIDDEYPAYNDQQHELKLFASHKLGRFNLSAAWIFGSGKPWDYITYYNNFKPTADYQRNSMRLPSYHRLDVSASYEQKLGSALLTITGSIFNVYDRSNITLRPYSFSSTPAQDVASGKSPLIYTDLYGFAITPSIYVNLAF